MLYAENVRNKENCGRKSGCKHFPFPTFVHVKSIVSFPSPVDVKNLWFQRILVVNSHQVLIKIDSPVFYAEFLNSLTILSFLIRTKHLQRFSTASASRLLVKSSFSSDILHQGCKYAGSLSNY